MLVHASLNTIDTTPFFLNFRESYALTPVFGFPKSSSLNLSAFLSELNPALLISGGVAYRTCEAGSPYPFAGLTLLVRAAEERGARFGFGAAALLEDVDEVDEFEYLGASFWSSSRRLRSCTVVGRRPRSSEVE